MAKSVGQRLFHRQHDHQLSWNVASLPYFAYRVLSTSISLCNSTVVCRTSLVDISHKVWRFCCLVQADKIPLFPAGHPYFSIGECTVLEDFRADMLVLAPCKLSDYSFLSQRFHCFFMLPLQWSTFGCACFFCPFHRIIANRIPYALEITM